MKKFLLSLVFAVCLANLFAQINTNSGMLTIGTTGNSNLKFVLNGKKISAQNRFLTYQQLAAGNYSLVIYQWQNGGRVTNGNSIPQGVWRQVYKNNVFIKNNIHTEIVVLKSGKVVIDEDEVEYDDWVNGNADLPTYNGGGWGNNYPHRGGGIYNGNTPYYYNIADNETFNKIKNMVSSEFRDEDKLNVAKATFKNGIAFSIEQIKEFTRLFFKEELKCDFLSFAYDYCYEPQFYLMLKDELFSNAQKKKFIEDIKNR